MWPIPRKKLSALRKAIFLILGHKPPIKEETTQNIESYLF